MRHFRTLAITLIVLLAAALGAHAQSTPQTDPSASTAATPRRDALTLKERLGAKWKDEQRVDNCKVPPEKRGATPRPDSCAHPKSQ